MNNIIEEYNFPTQFPLDVNIEINKIKKEGINVNKRVDFSKKLTITIDPADAKDFDDAISYQEVGENEIEIGIHIADVTHYVRENSAIDREAQRRGTSIYLVDKVLPMLPEILSEKICSLRPKEKKYTFSVVFLMDKKGKIKDTKFLKTVILSDYRFSYDEIQSMLDNKTNVIYKEHSLKGKKEVVNKDVFEMITTLNNIAKKTRKERMQKGGIEFNRSELKFVLDKKKNPIATQFKTPTEATKLIEDFMLLANKAVAEFYKKESKRNPFVYRVHESPDLEKLKELNAILKKKGYRLNFKRGNFLALSINNVLSKIEGAPDKKLIETLILRSMAKAKYTTKNKGHYGLGYNFYTHFTSPIRRYADVMVHRLLFQLLENKKTKGEEQYEKMCLYTSKMEEIAVKAERESIKEFMVKSMVGKENQVFEGIISGMVERGIFIELVENGCEGMLRIKDVFGDYFKLNTREHAFIGVKTKKRFALGDLIRIKVKKVNLKRLRIDFLLYE